MQTLSILAEKQKPCPYLPLAEREMDWRCLHRLGESRGVDFYFTALRYGQYLWQKGLSARAVLALDRALYSDLNGREDVLRDWPLPYRALQWLLQHHGRESFIGNPRVSFQHLAGRVKGTRREQRMWRAWACWYITRQCLPEMEPDRRHKIVEPARTAIAAGLHTYGIPEEVEWWLGVVEKGSWVKSISHGSDP